MLLRKRILKFERDTLTMGITIDGRPSSVQLLIKLFELMLVTKVKRSVQARVQFLIKRIRTSRGEMPKKYFFGNSEEQLW